MSQKLKRVLFVDDNHEFLSIIENILGGYSQGIWEIFTAQHAGMAFHTIQEKQIDLVVVDVRMPVIDGLEFLTLLNRQHPNVAKAVMTGDVTDATRAACLSRGAEVFLQKPALPQDWQNIFKTLNEIGRTGSEDGFRGVLRRVGLQDVLQMECLSRNSSVLEVKARQIQGLIFIEAGQVVHAEVGQRMGEEAFNYLMGLSGGEFNLKPFSPPRAKTISIAWEFLLMEAARKRDEAGSASGAETGAPNAERMEPPPSTLDIGQAPAPPPSDSQLSDPFKSLRTQFLVRTPQGEPAPPQRPEIAEFVILSSQGDVLYKWQCEDINGRIGFVEFLSQRARQIAQGLPLGPFERFEVHGSKSRVITQVDAEHGLFVRTNLVPASAPAPS